MLLPWLILIPFIGGLLCWQSETFSPKIPRYIALIAMGLTLAFSILLWYQLRFTIVIAHELPQWPVEYLLAWIPRFGISIHLILDGLSILMVVLTNLLGMLAVICSWHEIKRYHGLFYLNLLWISSSVIGVFMAMDLFLFFFFWEIMLFPMYFLIVLWGHKDSCRETRLSIANKFVIYTQVSGFIMLVAILALVIAHYNTTSVWTFNYNDLLFTPMSDKTEYLIMLGFFLAFAVKMPIVPLHGWLPDVHSQVSSTGSVDLAGLLVKTAAYGLLRFSLPLFPQASYKFAPIAMLFGVVSIFYGALVAFTQIDMKRLIAYANISHMGVVLIAIYSGQQLAFQGAVVQMIAHSLSAAGLFIICGQLYERLHTRDMRLMGGLWGQCNLLPAFTLFFALAMLGLPGTGNFVGEIIILLGCFPVVPIITVIVAVSLIFSAIYSLIMMQRIYYGPIKTHQLLTNITFREQCITLLLVILLVLLGSMPQPIMNTSAAAINSIQHWFAVHTSSSMLS